MPRPAWPADVPQQPMAGSYAEAIDDNLDVFQPEKGRALRARDSSIPSRSISYTTVPPTKTQKDRLASFWRDELKDGVLAFDRIHPHGGEPIVAVFAEGLQFGEFAPGFYTARIVLSVDN